MTPPTLSPEVVAFCNEKGILPILHNVIRLMQEAFPGSKMEIVLEHFPDDPSPCVLVDTYVEGAWEDAFEKHLEVLKRWGQGETSPFIRPLYWMV
jgi:hypothetical protein